MNAVAHTAIYERNAHVLTAECGMSQPFDSNLEPLSEKPEMYKFSAIWDTGSESTTISRNAASELGLKPIGEIEAHHSGGHSIVNLYLINLLLPNGIEYQGLRVMDGNFDDTDILLGMDVISQCDFALTHPGEFTKLSIQIPSQANIDFENTTAS